MAGDKTGLEVQEEQVNNVIFGKPTGIGAGDKSMLEMTETNRLVINSRQSELQIGVSLLHAALFTEDNIKPEYKRVKDSEGNWTTERVYTDNWKWLLDLDHMIRTNQLTIRGYSRSQHLRQSAQMLPVSPEEEQEGFWQRIMGK